MSKSTSINLAATTQVFNKLTMTATMPPQKENMTEEDNYIEEEEEEF